MHISDEAIGYIGVAVAVLFFGSFGVPLKTKAVQDANVDPVIFQIYYSISIFASSWIVLSYNHFVFTPYGIAGASLWVPASILSIAAINHLGMSVAVGMWAGVTIVVSFLWGAIAFPHENKVHSIPIAATALFMLVTGILGLSLSNTPYVKNIGRSKSSGNIVGSYKSQPDEGDVSPLLTQSGRYVYINTTVSPNQPKKRPIVGVVCALLLGIMNGSLMVPLHYVPKEAQGIVYIVSFGIGVIIVTPVIALIYFIALRKRPVFHLRVALVPGLITGLIWNIGNFGSIYATLHLNLTIGYPLTQLALVISGLWGLFVFKELSGVRTITMWVISLIVLLGGAALLALFG